MHWGPTTLEVLRGGGSVTDSCTAGWGPNQDGSSSALVLRIPLTCALGFQVLGVGGGGGGGGGASLELSESLTRHGRGRAKATSNLLTSIHTPHTAETTLVQNGVF